MSNGVPLEAQDNKFIELHMDNASEDSQETHRPETANLGKASEFSQLKSHRQEVRRSFSPPFLKENSQEYYSAEKEEVDNSCQKKLDFVQVTKTEVFHDSLDDLPKSLSQILSGSIEEQLEQSESKTQVMNEEG